MKYQVNIYAKDKEEAIKQIHNITDSRQVEEVNEYNLENLKKSLIEELNDNKSEILDNKYPDDLISEYVDSNVPIYHFDILQYGAENTDLGTYEPDIYAFDGKPTAVNAIAGRIYEELSETAQKWLSDNQ